VSERDELLAVIMEADKTADSPTVFTIWDHLTDAVILAGYRKIFDGDCGLSNVKDPTDREAAEAWMRWANIVSGNDGNGIAAMKQMLTELGYRKVTS